MKKIIIAIAFLATNFINAQNSLFNNISTTDIYQEYYGVYDQDKDGFYEIKNKRFLVKFTTSYLPTGEGYQIVATVDEESSSKGHVQADQDAVEGDYFCYGYPYEAFMKHKYDKKGFVSIGDYVFIIRNISKDGTSFSGIDHLYIKKGAATAKTESGKKKKMSLKERIKALKNKGKDGGTSPAVKALQSQNINKLITDYLVAMKAKQDARTAKELQGDANVKAAKNKGTEDIKRYNDSIKATPEYQDLQRRIEQNRINSAASKSRNTVTLRNNTGNDIYVGTSGSRNPGTKISRGGTASWNCSQDAYLQSITVSGGSRAYSTTNTRVYSSNSSCGNTININ